MPRSAAPRRRPASERSTVWNAPSTSRPSGSRPTVTELSPRVRALERGPHLRERGEARSLQDEVRLRVRDEQPTRVDRVPVSRPPTLVCEITSSTNRRSTSAVTTPAQSRSRRRTRPCAAASRGRSTPGRRRCRPPAPRGTAGWTRDPARTPCGQVRLGDAEALAARRVKVAHADHVRDALEQPLVVELALSMAAAPVPNGGGETTRTWRRIDVEELVDRGGRRGCLFAGCCSASSCCPGTRSRARSARS